MAVTCTSCGASVSATDATASGPSVFCMSCRDQRLAYSRPRLGAWAGSTAIALAAVTVLGFYIWNQILYHGSVLGVFVVLPVPVFATTYGLVGTLTGLRRLVGVVVLWAVPTAAMQVLVGTQYAVQFATVGGAFILFAALLSLLCEWTLRSIQSKMLLTRPVLTAVRVLVVAILSSLYAVTLALLRDSSLSATVRDAVLAPLFSLLFYVILVALGRVFDWLRLLGQQRSR